MADISQITVDGVTYDIKDLIARAVASSKTTVTVGSALSSGTQIATITVDGTPYIIYAPAPSQSIDLGELYDQLGGWQSNIQEIIYTIYGYDRTAFSTLSVEEALSILADIGTYYPDIQVSLGSGTPIATISDGNSTTTLYAPTPPSPYTSNPVMDGTASPGSSANYSRGDHRHPTDTSRQATLVSGTNIKTVNGNSLLGSGNVAIATSFYGTCSTAAGTAAKVVTLSDATGWSLKVGVIVGVKFTATNTASNPTINVNSSGAKSIYFNSAVITTANLNKAGYANRIEYYMYDGTYWVWINWSTDDNTTYSSMTVAEYQAGTGTTARLITPQRLLGAINYHRPIYVTNQGTVSGGWMYRVWSNNFQEVWFRGTVTYTSASSSYQGWYRSIQNITIPISSMTGMTAFADDAATFASGAHTGHIHTCAGVRTNGTQFEAQTLGMNVIAANTVTTGWSVYIAGYKR